MPTQSTTYNSRVTDEALEKRFRDTFRSQGGAELVDDLYAQGVIVPVVDFTAAATGQQLGTDLQTAWDFGTTYYEEFATGVTSVISNAGFWRVGFSGVSDGGATANSDAYLRINDGTTTKNIYVHQQSGGTVGADEPSQVTTLIVFLRSGDSLELNVTRAGAFAVWSRQIATVTGDLIDPTGFTSS